jgi:hypothetical protein
MNRDIAMERARPGDLRSVERAIGVLPIGTQAGVPSEQRRGADFRAAAVIRALGGDLGRCRLLAVGGVVT